MALQGALQRVDLQQVDAHDRRPSAPDYLFKPTISFAVASSPELPAPRAR